MNDFQLFRSCHPFLSLALFCLHFSGKSLSVFNVFLPVAGFRCMSRKPFKNMSAMFLAPDGIWDTSCFICWFQYFAFVTLSFQMTHSVLLQIHISSPEASSCKLWVLMVSNYQHLFLMLLLITKLHKHSITNHHPICCWCFCIVCFCIFHCTALLCYLVLRPQSWINSTTTTTTHKIWYKYTL